MTDCTKQRSFFCYDRAITTVRERIEMNCIVIKDLSKQFGQHLAVDNLSLTIETGKFLVYWDQMAQEKVRRFI